MEPIGPLMHEHRLIERMIALLSRERERIDNGQEPDRKFLMQAVDFIRTYADRCHHGKEEEILFAELERKRLSPEHRRMVGLLKREHIYGRQLTAALEESVLDGASQGACKSISRCLEKLASFYPDHIRREDKEFFFPCLEYFDKAERQAMLERFEEFEASLLHDKYYEIVEKREEMASGERE